MCATLRSRIADTMVSVHFWKDTVTFRLDMSFQYAFDTSIYDPNAFRYDSEAFVCNYHTFQKDSDAFMKKLHSVS